jgi:acyl-[acyl-carrier-protein]-phospholipid O-acyltransferase/long-chain-fatty-acid--[acyl-carrier-protein] ligase
LDSELVGKLFGAKTADFAALREAPNVAVDQRDSEIATDAVTYVAMTTQPQIQRDELPPLARDRSFWGMTVTQFLGAFNDNLFKQLVLLMCVDLATEDRSQNLQGVAMIIFSAPFILFSGFGGFLSDRTMKRKIIIWCKVAEIAIMLMGLLAFLSNSWPALFVVLFLMGTQSAFFGPAKYGILPEMVREHDLPRANGVILMTTFLAIIFGFALAGEIKEAFPDKLWLACGVCVLIAVLGTLTSLSVRKTPIAQPRLRFEPSALAVNPETRRLLRADRDLLGVLLISSVFWFIGGVVYPPAINDLGKLQLQVRDAVIGRLAACTGIGIAIGCVLAGRLSRNRVDSRLVRVGAWGMFICLVLLALPRQIDNPTQFGETSTLLGVWGAAFTLIGLGTFAGFFTVPLQVYLQAKAPESQKGRIIGTMNLANWIGIALSGVYYDRCNVILDRLNIPPCGMFAAAAILIFPVAVFYRPRDLELK